MNHICFEIIHGDSLFYLLSGFENPVQDVVWDSFSCFFKQEAGYKWD
jgi:hypothetical protein